ncbi:peptidylprolyl isomerase [Nostoc flagelliforme FACHB-838]|uniref:peptidylprolyl isomerase n=1 Tax=Nostoc flagelliforme FACHB-838 TaxID=2692904 RepID=A0ABR8DWP1_9NOSO|nr:peptidylprolyl isomerase [Nostoc flagelliforme]MBD2533307.1 peptidylprolyl isomerase [Nostoc flagelliforme FACHB-838]
MTEILKIDNRIITSEEIIPLLTRYHILPRFILEIIIDQAIDSITCKDEEVKSYYKKYCEANKLTSQTERQAWLECYQMTIEELENLATRGLKINKFKQETWNDKLESYFFNRKSQLDKVSYSVIWNRDFGLAQELYFRIQGKENSFAEIARAYSQGLEAKNGGFVSAVEVSSVHPSLMKILSVSQPGQLLMPIQLGEWVVILQLEKLFVAQLDAPMRQQLLDEIFADWLQERLKSLSNIAEFRISNSKLSMNSQ